MSEEIAVLDRLEARAEANLIEAWAASNRRIEKDATAFRNRPRERAANVRAPEGCELSPKE